MFLFQTPLICFTVCYSSAFFWLSVSTYSKAVFGALRGGQKMGAVVIETNSIQFPEQVTSLMEQRSHIPCPGPYEHRGDPALLACIEANQFVFEVVAGFHCCTLASTSGESEATAKQASTGKNWIQIHQSIHGDMPDDRAGLGEGNGNGVAFSGDGNVVVISSRYNDGAHDDAGHVRLFKNSEFGWVQLGQTLEGSHGGEHFGFSTSISFHGSIIAIGGIRHKGHEGAYQGRVQVYHLVHEDDFLEKWEPMGAALEGEAMLDYFGYDISLNDDGTIMAVGAVQHVGGSGNYEGYVHLYHWHESFWKIMGLPIVGKENGDQLGSSVSLSGNGKVVAVGSKFHKGPNGEDSGSVEVHRYSHGLWRTLGTVLYGEGEGDHFGGCVALSDDGATLVVGAENNHGANGASSGHVRVFRYQMHTNDWIQLGQDIDGEGDGHGSGVSVAIGGSNVAIGAIHADSPDGVDGVGQLRLFEYNAYDDRWIQLGDTIYGDNKDDHLGHSVSFAIEGNRFVVSAPKADTQFGVDSGTIKIYELKEL